MRKHVLLGALLISSLSAAPAEAAFVSYLLNQTNADPTLADNVNYARVTIDDNTANAITFTVSLLSPLTSIAGSNFGVQEFNFNVVGTNPLVDAAGTNTQWTLPAGWSANVAPPANQADGFGRFEVSISTSGAGRLTPLNLQLINTGLGLASFAENSTGNALQGNVFFAAHVSGFNAGNNVTSAYFGGSTTEPTVVPLPASAWLFSSGLATGLAFFRKCAGRKAKVA